MKNPRGLTISLIIGLALALSSVAFAQNTGTAANKTNESCCTMPACCGQGDSCPMKDGEGAMKEGSCCKGNKTAVRKDSCCDGDSCKMKGMKHQPRRGQ